MKSAWFTLDVAAAMTLGALLLSGCGIYFGDSRVPPEGQLAEAPPSPPVYAEPACEDPPEEEYIMVPPPEPPAWTPTSGSNMGAPVPTQTPTQPRRDFGNYRSSSVPQGNSGGTASSGSHENRPSGTTRGRR